MDQRPADQPVDNTEPPEPHNDEYKKPAEIEPPREPISLIPREYWPI